MPLLQHILWMLCLYLQAWPWQLHSSALAWSSTDRRLEGLKCRHSAWRDENKLIYNFNLPVVNKTYHYLGLKLTSTCFGVQKRWGNTTMLSSPLMINGQKKKKVKRISHTCTPLVLLAYQEASNESSSIPCWSIGLKRSVRGNGTLAKKEQTYNMTSSQTRLEWFS